MISIVIALVARVLLPVTHVDRADAAHEQLEFVLVENLQHRQRNEILKTVQKGSHLQLNPGHKPPLNHQTVNIKPTLQLFKNSQMINEGLFINEELIIEHVLDILVLVLISYGYVSAVGL